MSECWQRSLIELFEFQSRTGGSFSCDCRVCQPRIVSWPIFLRTLFHFSIAKDQFCFVLCDPSQCLPLMVLNFEKKTRCEMSTRFLQPIVEFQCLGNISKPRRKVLVSLEKQNGEWRLAFRRTGFEQGKEASHGADWEYRFHVLKSLFFSLWNTTRRNRANSPETSQDLLQSQPKLIDLTGTRNYGMRHRSSSWYFYPKTSDKNGGFVIRFFLFERATEILSQT